jgi:hypothetical protein
VQTTEHKTIGRVAEFQPAAVKSLQRRSISSAVPVGLQASSMRVSSPHDSAEREADSTAKRVMRMSIPEGSVAYVKTPQGGLFRQVGEKEEKKKLQRSFESPYIARFSGALLRRRAAEGQPNVASNVAAEIQSATASGAPLPLSVRRFMEPRFNADFSNVKVHTGDKSAKLNRAVNAQAFAVGNNIFFGKDKFKPESREGKELIAHELTHTIQQGAAVQRSEDVPVTERSQPQVQRLGVSDALDYFADKANIIPGFRMFTIILGLNPINMSAVDRSAANILRALVEFIPGGALIVQALDNYGIFERIGTWVDQQIRSLGMVGSSIRQAVMDFINSLSWTDIFDLGGVWNRAKRIFTEPIDRIIAFAKGLATGIIRFIKDAILRPIAGLAAQTRGWDLLTAVLGFNPITGDPVPRNADTLVGGFMKLIGQEEIWQNIKKANAIARCWAWFQGALSGVMGFVQQIPGLFLAALQALEIVDIVLLPRAFVKVGTVFGNFIGQFISWAGNTIWNLLQIIFEVVAPGAVPYIQKAAGAFRTILRNPIAFVGNLVRAGLMGLRQFAGNFLNHLRASLVSWLTGTLSGAGVYVPQSFTLREIIKFVLSVLGLTWQNVRQKLVRVIGETAVKLLETGFDIVVTLVTQGPAAAWEKIQESLSNLKDMVLEQIMTFVRERVVQAAITRLVTSLNPAGAFIQAIIAIYNTVMFFVERLRQIAQVAMAFIDSIAAIASGSLGAAANRVEQTMAGLLTLVISFLARIAGLGKVSDAVVGIVNRVRAPIDKALDRVIDWIVKMAKRFLPTKAGEPDNEASRKVKEMVKADVSGKQIDTPEQAAALISGVYGKLSAKGLKGIRVIYDPKKSQDIGIKVSASPAVVVANLPVLKKGLAEALSYTYKFNYLAGTTVLYVTYDSDGKSYAPVIENEANFEHAEMVFKRVHLSQLKAKIAADRTAGKLKTPPGQRVRVELSLNRLPCPNCAPILAILAGTNPDLQFVVNASSASNMASADITIQYIEQLLDAGIEVNTLKIFEAIQNKIVQIVTASKAKQIKSITQNEFLLVQAALPVIRNNLAQEKRLQDMIDSAVKNAQRKKALAAVAPQGSVP